VKRRLLVVIGLVGLLCAVLAGPAGAAEAGSSRSVSVSPVTAADGSVTGYSVLRRGGTEARFRLLTSKLEAGHAYTIWWVVFNHPEHCAGATSPVRCGMADMANPDVDASALFADGGVVGRFGVGWFSGSLPVDDPTGAIMGTGLHDATGADIHFVVRDHGPASSDPEILYQQTHTFGACNPDCADVQSSVHETR
jgi:hypothetical protein